MRKNRQLALDNANHRIPKATSDALIEDLKNVLSQDGSIEASYQAAYMLTKYCELDAGQAEVRRSKAIAKWRSVEEHNGFTSFALTDKRYLDTPFYEGLTVRRLLERMRHVVYDVIGATPSLDIAYAAYSGGASTSKRRSQGHPALKFLGKADSTRRAWNNCRHLFDGTRYADHLYAGLEPRLVDGSVLFTVPKNSEIDRVACKEPDINVFLQKCFGSQVRFLLKRKGIDLNDQNINGELARKGSVDGSLATLDLSSASDSISTELVRKVLPFDWFYWLDSCRSERILIDGESHQLRMFSSMGNGFTFELESLLFFALCRSCAYLTGIRGRISVYGDDLIIPTELAPCVISALRSVGFTPNEGKSFVDGPFRESCGKYWHAGIDVKPFFIKGPIVRLTDLIKTLNAVIAWASKTLGVVDPQYEEFFNRWKSLVPHALWGGQDLSSITSLVTGDKPRKELREVVKQRRMCHIGGYLHWMQTTALRTSSGLVESLGSSNTGKYRVKKNHQQRTDLPIFLGRYVDITESNDQ